jgi:hypothetical protein
MRSRYALWIAAATTTLLPLTVPRTAAGQVLLANF